MPVPTVLQVRSNGQITLPTSVRRLARLKEGDLLEVILEQDGSLRLVPKVAIDRSQAYFWSQRWQQGEQEAQAGLQQGQYRDFDNIDDFIRSFEQDDESA